MIAVIADQLKLFRHQLGRHVFFVGSDAVLQPYEMTVEQMLERLALDWAGDRVAALPPDHRPAAALDAYAAAVPDHRQRCEQLAERLADLRPGEGDVQLARLIKDGYVPLLFSMSPDDSLERALTSQRMTAGEDYHLVVAGSHSTADIALAVRESSRVVVVKGGGDLHAHVLPMTAREIASVLGHIAPLLAQVFARTALFVAYTQRDQPFLSTVPRDGDKIYWANRHIPVDDPKAVDDMRLESPDAEQYHTLQPEVVALLAARNSSRNLLCREPGRFNEFFGRVAERLRRRSHGPHVRRRELSVRPGGPFKFLESFDTHDVEVYAGREAEIEQLYDLVRAHRLVTLFGRSAVGKTSLLRAGLIPRLRRASQDEADGHAELPWLPAYARIGAEPVRDLRLALAAQVEQAGHDPDIVSEAEDLSTAVLRCIEVARHRPVLIADNVHELFLKLSQAARDEFAQQVADLVHDSGLLANVVFAVREDYLGDVFEFSAYLPDVLCNLMRLRRLTRLQAEDAIVKPAATFGIQFERNLVDQLVEDLDREGVLPAHLQIVCHRLLEEGGLGRSFISAMLYRRLGGSRKILDDYIDHAVSQLPVTDRRVAWHILRALAAASETLASMPMSELSEKVAAARPVFDRVSARLVDLRLLRPLDRDGVRHFELIHDLVADDIRSTLARTQPQTAQSAHDILTRGIDNFRLTVQLLERGEMHAVNDERDSLKLSAQELELLIRSAVYDDIEPDYWLARLGEIRDASYRVLTDMLYSDDPRIGGLALKHAREHLGQPLIEPLAKAADSEGPERDRARELLQAMERDLVAALSADDGRLRRWAAVALSRINGRRRLRELVSALSDTYPEATEHIADALAEVDAAGAARLLLADLRGQKLRWAAAEALGRLAQEQSVMALLPRALSRQAASPYLAYAYGLALLRQRRYEEALESLQRARTLAETRGVQAAGVRAAIERVEGALARSRRGEDRWPMGGGSASHTYYLPEPVRTPLREFWTSVLDSEVSGGVVMARGLVFAGLRAGVAVALDASSGAVRWRHRLPDRLEVSPVVLADRVFFVTSDGAYQILAFESGVVASGRLEVPPRAPLTVTDNLLLVGDRTGGVTALAADDLSPKWRHRFSAEVTAAPSAANGMIFAASWDASVVALDPQHGEVVWHWQGDAPVAGAVAVGEDLAVWDDDGGAVVAADPATGEILWRSQLTSGSRAAPAVSPDYVVVGCLDGVARCLSSQDGTLCWEFPTNDQILASALITGDIAYVASRDGSLYAVDANTGERRWRYTTSYGLYAPPAVVEGVLFAVLRQRQVVAFTPEEETVS